MTCTRPRVLSDPVYAGCTIESLDEGVSSLRSRASPSIKRLSAILVRRVNRAEFNVKVF